ncbi:DUF397 domain-containing protein [Catenuloplanes japonicus]|uniref:DUF397 domain-containing protein n=1 Tax=Catenuloplanes japonicus TaxID=33876 RepID=UPI000A11245C|nr:DUF397 domain-containing protein [Catenuloplanes japonicus]
MHNISWFKSSRCIADLHCVEVMRDADSIFVRDSKYPDFAITFHKGQWTSFTLAVKSGRFDAEKNH